MPALLMRLHKERHRGDVILGIRTFSYSSDSGYWKVV
jgi:hypothetical protein